MDEQEQDDRTDFKKILSCYNRNSQKLLVRIEIAVKMEPLTFR